MNAGRETESGPLDWVEEAFRLLRSAPAGLLGCYYLGSVPFVLLLLFFWADMSASPFAPARLLPLSGLLALFYLWMKSWQAVFVIGLRRHFTGSGDAGWSARRVGLLVATQAAIQPSGLLIAPLSFCLILPWPMVAAFYHHASAMEPGPDESIGSAFRQTARQSAAGPGRSAGLLGLLALLAGVVFLNIATGFLLLPSLMKILTGEEALFTRDLSSAFNTTFLAVIAGATYLCVDPLARAAWLLRRFYAESTGSGEDLRLGLRNHVLAKAALVLVLVSHPAMRMGAASDSAEPRPRRDVTTAKQAPVAELNSDALNQALRQTLKHDEFAWRLPKEKLDGPEKPRGVITQFLLDLFESLRKLGRSVGRWIKSWFQSDSAPAPSGGRLGGGSLNTFLTFALLAAAALLALWFWRWLAARRAVPAAAASVLPVQPAPDLADENQRPDALPSDQWMRLALEMAAAGQTRLALRAFYLACLAHLAAKQFIHPARYKSNYDYAVELARRARANPELAPLFRENVDAFDRAWYGSHPVDGETLARFEANTKALRAC